MSRLCRTFWRAAGIALAGLALVADPAEASNDCAEPVARIVSIEGIAEVKDAPQKAWRPAPR